MILFPFFFVSGEFKKKELTCCTTQDYYLVPGRMSTFIPAGTKVTVFGQLPNKRWRCLVEMDELIKTMNGLVKDLGSNPASAEPINKQQTVNTAPSATKSVVDIALGISMGKATNFDETKRNNIPDYPLFGSLPTSVLKFSNNSNININNENTDIRESATPIPDDEITVEIPEQDLGNVTLSPYSTHTREQRKTPLKSVVLDDLEITDFDQAESDSKSECMLEETLGRPRDASTITQESNFEEFSGGAAESDVESDENGDNVSLDGSRVPKNLTPNFLRGKVGSGFVISKKLRQKGISIIVGSSSSEGKELFHFGYTDHSYAAILFTLGR